MTDDRPTPDLGGALADLMTELVDGPPGRAAFMLNQGDVGLLRSLEQLSWAAAVAPAPGGGPPVSQHVDHVRYGLSLMNRWGGGEANPFATADWGASWELVIEGEEEWAQLRDALGREAHAWIEALRSLGGSSGTSTLPIEPIALRGMIGSIAHLAYHLGSIRQVDRATRGPSDADSTPAA